jgi:hypothetical protein
MRCPQHPREANRASGYVNRQCRYQQVFGDFPCGKVKVLRTAGWGRGDDETAAKVREVEIGLYLITACSIDENAKKRELASDDRKFQYPLCTATWAETQIRKWKDDAVGRAKDLQFQQLGQKGQIKVATSAPKPSSGKGKGKGGNSSGSGNGTEKQYHKWCDICGPGNHWTTACDKASDELKDAVRKAHKLAVEAKTKNK